METMERFWEKVDTTGECWVWTAAVSNGYGRFATPKGRTNLAHKFLYEETVGPVPEGMELDHLCRNRACVRPDHLEPVTRKENLNRSPILNRVNRKKRTHCKKGHEYTAENTYTWREMRKCRTCHRENMREQRKRK